MKQLHALDIGGIEYRVMRASVKEYPGLEGKLGVCDYETSTIYLHESMHVSRMKDTLLHEIFHAVIYESGAGHLMGLHIDEKNLEDVEESFIRMVSPSLLQVLRQLKGKLP